MSLVGAGDEAGRTINLADSGLISVGDSFSLYMYRPGCNRLVRRFPIVWFCGS